MSIARQGQRAITVLSACAAGLAAIALAPAALAQEAGSRQTREFVEAAGQSDRFEILEAQTVLGQSTDVQVRAFAEKMIRDHDQMSQTLAQAAARAGLKPTPPGISADQASLLGALQSQRGPEFEQTYVKHQALAHRAALAVERAYAATGDDPDVRQVAAAATPTIAAHLAMAEQMRAKLGGP